MPARRRRLDTRLLYPRAYFTNPHEFGQRPDLASHLPAEGDERSRQVAQAQHTIACLIRTHARPHDAARLTERFGFSKQLWSSCLNGHAWMPQPVWAAAATLVVGRALQWPPPNRD
ncbi:hypothetical protein [Nocardioides sambongensis]|uniref:hypothetical protein n=1 Tax=Nocardioides sambongensis TaxID=2589074 RepID=UPI001129C5DB|nr:hypothetical protein [Nocardioides sambongensis]